MSEPKKPRAAPMRADSDLYRQALTACKKAGRFTTSQIRREIGCSRDRAMKILVLMQDAGELPATAPTQEMPERQWSKRKSKSKVPPETTAECAERVDEVGDLTIRQVVDRFGTETKFLNWLDALKKLEDIESHRLKNETIKGTLVNRDLVKTGVLDNVEEALLKMLTDGARTISTLTVEIVKAGGSSDEVLTVVEDQLSSYIKPMKEKIRRFLLADKR